MAAQPQLGIFSERDTGSLPGRAAHPLFTRENLNSLTKENKHMKYITYPIIMIAAALTISCNKQKERIDDAADATEDVLESRKDQVEDNAESAKDRAEANADVEKARIEANKESDQAQLDADIKKAEAEAEAAKAKVDAENQ